MILSLINLLLKFGNKLQNGSFNWYQSRSLIFLVRFWEKDQLFCRHEKFNKCVASLNIRWKKLCLLEDKSKSIHQVHWWKSMVVNFDRIDSTCFNKCVASPNIRWKKLCLLKGKSKSIHQVHWWESMAVNFDGMDSTCYNKCRQELKR